MLRADASGCTFWEDDCLKVKLGPGAKMPNKKFPTDAGADICANHTETIPVGERRTIHTGLYFKIPKKYEVQVRSRSGLAAKHGVFVLNGIGTIDESYTGEIMVVLYNSGTEEFRIDMGDRIAQIVLSPIYTYSIKEVDVIEETDRGSGGFGSTGVK